MLAGAVTIKKKYGSAKVSTTRSSRRSVSRKPGGAAFSLGRCFAWANPKLRKNCLKPVTKIHEVALLSARREPLQRGDFQEVDTERDTASSNCGECRTSSGWTAKNQNLSLYSPPKFTTVYRSRAYSLGTGVTDSGVLYQATFQLENAYRNGWFPLGQFDATVVIRHTR